MRSATTAFERSMGTFGDRMTGVVTTLAVMTLFFISNLMLQHLGIEYETPGGSPLEKIHPATYLATMAFGLMLVVRLNPFDGLDDIVTHHKGTVALFFAWLALLAHITFVQQSPFTMVVDTFLLPILFLVLLTRLSEANMRFLAWFLHALMAANAILGFVEIAIEQRMTPLVANGVALTGDWRATAFLGHPLANATATGAYILIMILGGGRDLPPMLRVAALSLQVPAMAVFGGRAAMVLLGLFGGIVLARQLTRVVAGRRITLPGAATLAVILPAAVAGTLALGVMGFFDRFLERFVEDDGSAETRVNMLVLLGQIPTRELWFGPDPEHVATLQILEGLEFGIESFWIAFLAYYGILICIPFFVAFFAFILDLWKVTQPQSWWVLVYFVLVCSTSASLSGKTTSFAVFVCLLLILLRVRPDAGPADPRRNGSG